MIVVAFGRRKRYTEIKTVTFRYLVRERRKNISKVLEPL